MDRYVRASDPSEVELEASPYAALVIRTLQLIVPLAGAVAVSAQPQAKQGNAQAHLQVMSTLIADLLVTAEPATAEIGLKEATGKITAAEGGDADPTQRSGG
jgi:hypothetical protein